MPKSWSASRTTAFKFTPENGRVDLALSQFERDGAQWLRYQVSDTGVGISAEHVKHIFESFYQIDVHYAGSGIGLALVKAFAEMHKGTVSVDSAKGKGTIFTIEMPMKQAGTLAEGLEKPERRGGAFCRPGNGANGIGSGG